MPSNAHSDQRLEDAPGTTKAALIDAAVETLKTKGFAGASAREIARTGSFNQALIFYHFGSIQNLMLAALDLVSARRMRAYESRFVEAQTIPELAQLAREIYDEDLENGYVTVLAEMVAGGVSDAELGGEVVARVQPWILPARDLAFAIIALYLGVDMLSQLEGDHARAESLLDLGRRYAPLAGVVLPSQRAK
jgi:AcrR family transcriptional regulator